MENETTETKQIKQTKSIKGFSIDMQKIIDLGYVPEDLDDYLNEITLEINWDNDPLKILVTDESEEYNEFTISIGQLNQSVYHVTKSSARAEAMHLIAASTKGDQEKEQ